ncbi:MAG: DUF1257 domain-containing protein [Cyanobacteriota bacterium]|jgi:hypothetical protein
MSHFTTIRTRIVDCRYLKQSLADLGHAVQQGPVTVNGYQHNTTEADFKIATGNPSYDIGFRRQGECYELVADWWGIRGINRDDFVRQLHQRYAYHAARETLSAEGFSLVEEERQPDGTLHLVLRRAV